MITTYITYAISGIGDIEMFKNNFLISFVRTKLRSTNV